MARSPWATLGACAVMETEATGWGSAVSVLSGTVTR